jgi:hypothetical protein
MESMRIGPATLMRAARIPRIPNTMAIAPTTVGQTVGRPRSPSGPGVVGGAAFERC